MAVNPRSPRPQSGTPALPHAASAPAPRAGPRPPSGARSWIAAHKALAATIALAVVVPAAVVAALTIRQDVTATTSATAPDVKFAQGTGYSAINTAGFATATIGSSGASATLALSGVSGAAIATLGDVLKLQNHDATQADTVTLARSAAPNAAITSFTVTVKDGATTLVTWDAASAATSSSFTLDAAPNGSTPKSLDITISTTIADGTAAGSLGSFAMQFTLAPA